MTDETISRARSIFAALEKTPCLIGYQLLDDGRTADDAVVQAACLHSIAISMRRIADALDRWEAER